ncbi:MAG: helix-turn-helix transcriptional regulator [Candidatus Uhrbacteria bacterium]|nr:helix-turn-helix transcriptional regulator [Candidatus Uhrbacteria bacterium]
MARFTSRLFSLRLAEQLSQDGLASELDVSRQTIHAIETGKSEPSLYLAHKCAQYFGLKIEQIFGYKD